MTGVRAELILTGVSKSRAHFDWWSEYGCMLVLPSPPTTSTITTFLLPLLSYLFLLPLLLSYLLLLLLLLLSCYVVLKRPRVADTAFNSITISATGGGGGGGGGGRRVATAKC